VLRYAVEHLPELLDDQALPVVARIAREQNYPRAAYVAFHKLGAKSVPMLVKMIGDQTNPEGQVFAADALSGLQTGDAPVISALTDALRSTSRSKSGLSLRAVAARALGEIGPSAKYALPGLELLRRDEDETTRRAAAAAIEKIKR
jgi:HEAT repeat protein